MTNSNFRFPRQTRKKPTLVEHSQNINKKSKRVPHVQMALFNYETA